MTYSPNFVGNTSNALSTSMGDSLQNNTGLTISKATPVKINIDGDYDLIDVASESDVLSIIGVTNNDVLTSENGNTLTIGRIENITTTAAFGDILYVSKTGVLTNVQPQIGVGGFLAGDFIVRVGVVFKNKITPAQKDLYLNISIIGQL